MLSDLILMQLAGVERDDLRAAGQFCSCPPDPRLLPFPLGRTFWQDRERCGATCRSTYRNDRPA